MSVGNMYPSQNYKCILNTAEQVLIQHILAAHYPTPNLGILK